MKDAEKINEIKASHRTNLEISNGKWVGLDWAWANLGPGYFIRAHFFVRKIDYDFFYLSLWILNSQSKFYEYCFSCLFFLVIIGKYEFNQTKLYLQIMNHRYFLILIYDLINFLGKFKIILKQCRNKLPNNNIFIIKKVCLQFN